MKTEVFFKMIIEVKKVNIFVNLNIRKNKKSLRKMFRNV